jgi:speckle-type POZ protein
MPSWRKSSQVHVETVLSHAIFPPSCAPLPFPPAAAPCYRAPCNRALAARRAPPALRAPASLLRRARRARACGMAAPAAVVAVSAPALAGKRRIVATTSLVPRVAVEYEWRLEGVTKEFFTAAAVGQQLDSPPFFAHGLEWTLRLYPNGDNDEGKGHVAVFVSLETQDATTTVTGTFGAGVEPDDALCASQVLSTCKPQPEGLFSTWGSAEYLPHTQLLKNFNAHVPGGVLAVRCSLRASSAGAAVHDAVSPNLPVSGLSASWGALLAGGKYADVTLLCGDERISAHRLVLCTRSPVFAAQLDAGPLQADASAVPVPPDITPHTLKLLLRFLYTDELEPESPEEATHLLNAADHYSMPRLFGICQRTLSASLRMDNAADTLMLADQHSAAALKGAALRFVAANAAAVMSTPGWAHLFASWPPLVLETMHTMATGAPPPPPQVPLTPARGAEGGGAAGEGSNTE